MRVALEAHDASTPTPGQAGLTALEALRDYTEQQEYDKMLVVLADALGEEQLATLMEEGRTWTEDQAVTKALLV